MQKTEAFVLTRFGSPEVSFELKEITLPDLKPDEVLIETEGFGLNYADVMARNGMYRETPPLPCVLGYEVVGKVVQCGSGVQNHLLGKRVVAFTRFGGYAKHAIARFTAVAEIHAIAPETAMALATQMVTARYMTDRAANVQKGENVLIHAAAGGVGSLLIQLCKLKGANVIAKVSSEQKKELVLSLGADKAIDYTATDYDKEVISFLPGTNLDVSFNPVGGESFPGDMQLLRAGGRVVLFGGSALKKGGWKLLNGLNFVRKMKILVPIALMMRSRSVMGVNMLKIGDERPELLGELLKESLELFRNSNIQITKGGVFSHQQLIQAHNLLESGKSIGKISVLWN